MFNNFREENRSKAYILKWNQGKQYRSSFLVCLFLLLAFSFALCGIETEAATKYTNDDVHMRSTPSTKGEILTTIESGKKVEVYGYEGDWADAEYDGINGYIKKSFLSDKKSDSAKSSKTDTSKGSSGSSSGKSASSSSSGKSSTSSKVQATAKINATDVNFRTKPKGDVIRKLEKGEKVSILSQGEDWSKIKTSAGEKGYVYNSYIGNLVSRSDKIKEWREAAVQYCKDHLEDKYSQEKRDEKGFCDCSSLMRDAFKNASGVMIGVNTVDQTDTMKDYLYKIDSIKDVKVGDIVYHLSGQDENHCAIYIGDDAVINASMTVGKVKVTYYDEKSKYWEYGCRAASYCYDEKY